MRKVLITLGCVALVAGLAIGGETASKRVVADFTTATQASNEFSQVVQLSGFLHQIDIIPSGTFTSNVAITYTPVEGTAVNIYTNIGLLAQTILLPVVDRTDVAGAALTSDAPTRYIIDGGLLTVVISNVTQTAATKAVVVIKTEK